MCSGSEAGSYLRLIDFYTPSPGAGRLLLRLLRDRGAVGLSHKPSLPSDVAGLHSTRHAGTPLTSNVQRFRGGLVCKAHRLCNLDAGAGRLLLGLLPDRGAVGVLQGGRRSRVPCACPPGLHPYRGTSLIRNSATLAPYRALWWTELVCPVHVRQVCTLPPRTTVGLLVQGYLAHKKRRVPCARPPGHPPPSKLEATPCPLQLHGYLAHKKPPPSLGPRSCTLCMSARSPP